MPTPVLSTATAASNCTFDGPPPFFQPPPPRHYPPAAPSKFQRRALSPPPPPPHPAPACSQDGIHRCIQCWHAAGKTHCACLDASFSVRGFSCAGNRGLQHASNMSLSLLVAPQAPLLYRFLSCHCCLLNSISSGAHASVPKAIIPAPQLPGPGPYLL